jgi:hypothetical protein
LSRRAQVDPRLIKIHRSYKVEELARLLGCHKNTVWLWLKQGLEPIDARRPLLIQGSVARRYLEAKRQSRKRRCLLHELYCLRCRDAREPADRRALINISPGQPSLLRARCCTCGTWMFKRISSTSLPKLQQALNLQICEGAETLKLAA